MISRFLKIDLRHLKTFNETYTPKKSFLVSMAPGKRLCGNSIVINWQLSLEQLWQGEII